MTDAPAPVLTYEPEPSAPTLALPPDACDSHVHVFGPVARFAYAPARTFTPVEAPKERLFALHRRLGIGRCVIVQSTCHGHDNRVVEDAIAAGGGRYLGIALVPTDVADGELARLAAAGFRGVRFNFMGHLGGGSDVGEVLALTERLAPHGLHLQVHFAPKLVHQLAAPLALSSVPVVVDHLGRVDATRGAGHRDFQALLAMMDNPLFRMKVSGVDRLGPGQDYAPGIALARRMVEAHPDRCLWGTDWPHPNHHHVPDDGRLVDALADIAPDPAVRARLLVDNPQAFYRFPA